MGKQGDKEANKGQRATGKLDPSEEKKGKAGSPPKYILIRPIFDLQGGAAY